MAKPTSTRHESPTPSSTAHTHDEDDINRSDPDSGTEKPVREQLRNTGLDSSQQQRGRLVKKRSHEEIGGEDTEDEAGTRHVRKRSREANGEDVKESTPETETTMEVAEGLASPKGKRTRDQVVGGVEASTEEAVGTEGERKVKRARDSGSPEGAVDMSEATTSPPKTAASTKVPPTSGFANTSAASPFGALAAKNDAPSKTTPQTSDEKFKSSGFGSFAATSASPFGSAAPKSTSPFGASAAAGSASPWAAKNPTPATQPSAFAAPSSKPASSGFGNTSSTSAFGGLGKPSSGGSVFGGTLGTSAFSTLGGGSKLSSFATPGSSAAPKIEGISSKPAKAFGASNDTDEESGNETDEDEEAAAGEKSTDQDKKDKRFYEQHIETGEEGETTMFAQRAKLYQFDKGEKKWVERGSGMLKLNISDPEPASSQATDKPNLSDGPEEDEAAPPRKVHARLLLRAEGSQRVVLNSPIVKGAKFGDDVEPKTQAILFLGRLAGAQAGEAGLDMLQMKMNAERAKALWHHVQELQDKLA